MMTDSARAHYRAILAEIEGAGLTKRERAITSRQGAHVRTSESQGDVLNFCANNYLSLSSHPDVMAAAREGLDRYGFGMSSVRFICGTQDAHLELERELAGFVGMDAAILYTSCFDANGGLFETILGEQDAVISDALNHASIIDGIRLCKAMRYRYEHADMADLRAKLEEASKAGARLKLVATDGAFSMDGDVAKLDEIVAIAEEFEAQVMVDDSHATGFVGPRGRGTHEHFGVMDRVDIVTSTLGKALGGAAGGFTAARREIVDLLRQRSRPYLFSNSVPPPIVAASRAVVRLLSGSGDLRERLMANTARFRRDMAAAGFDIRPGFHPIVPIMLGDAKLAVDFARDMLAEGIYVVGFSFPVVPKGQARIRVQLSAGHSTEDVDRAVSAFVKVGRRHGVVP